MQWRRYARKNHAPPVPTQHKLARHANTPTKPSKQELRPWTQWSAIMAIEGSLAPCLELFGLTPICGHDHFQNGEPTSNATEPAKRGDELYERRWTT